MVEPPEIRTRVPRGRTPRIVNDRLSALGRVNALLVAPDATRPELALGYGAALIGAAAAAAGGLVSGYGAAHVLLFAVLGFDIAGGVVVNATRAAARRFHHGPHWRRRSVLFVAAHVHPFVVALLFPAQTWWASAVLYLGLVASALLITSTPLALRRPVAFACAAALITWTVVTGPTEDALVWIAPLLVIKLLLAHLLTDSIPTPEAT